MPEITLDNDPTVFTMTDRKNRKVNLDIAEFRAKLAGQGYQLDTPDEQAMPMITKVFRSVAWPSEVVADLTDEQCIAFATKANLRFEELGNSLAGRPTS